MPRMAPSFFASDGQRYVRGLANLPVRRHFWEYENIELAQGKVVVLPLVYYADAPDTQAPEISTGNNRLVSLDGEVIPYHNGGGCEADSRVNGINIDLMIRPKEETDAAVLEIATMRCMTSMHDIKSGEVPMLREKGGSGTDKRQLQYTTTLTTIDISGSTPSFSSLDDASCRTGIQAGTNNFSQLRYQASIKWKHWWRGFRKQYIQGGLPVIYRKHEYIPRKIKRVQPGTFYALIISNLTSYGTAVPLVLNGNVHFDEMPLIDPSIYNA